MGGLGAESRSETVAPPQRALMVGHHPAGHAVQPGELRTVGDVGDTSPGGHEHLRDDVGHRGGRDPPATVGVDAGAVPLVQGPESLIGVDLSRHPLVHGLLQPFSVRTGPDPTLDIGLGSRPGGH